MPTRVINYNIEAFTLPRPWLRTLPAGKVGFLRDSVATVISKFGGAQFVPPQLRFEDAASPQESDFVIDPFDDEEFVTVTTTDATVTAIWTRTLDDNSVLRVEALVTARRTDAADSGTFSRVFKVYRQGGGATLGGAGVLVPVTDDESDATWNVTAAVSGNTVTLSVTGAAAKTVKWDGYVRIISA